MRVQAAVIPPLLFSHTQPAPRHPRPSQLGRLSDGHRASGGLSVCLSRLLEALGGVRPGAFGGSPVGGRPGDGAWDRQDTPRTGRCISLQRPADRSTDRAGASRARVLSTDSALPTVRGHLTPGLASALQRTPGLLVPPSAPLLPLPVPPPFPPLPTPLTPPPPRSHPLPALPRLCPPPTPTDSPHSFLSLSPFLPTSPGAQGTQAGAGQARGKDLPEPIPASSSTG